MLAFNLANHQLPIIHKRYKNLDVNSLQFFSLLKLIKFCTVENIFRKHR